MKPISLRLTKDKLVRQYYEGELHNSKVTINLTSSNDIQLYEFTNMIELPTVGLSNYYQQINNIIRNVRYKTTSRYGVIMVADYKDKQDFLIVKYSRIPDEDDLSHELCIGTYAINDLRLDLPNFIFTYGAVYGNTYIDGYSRRVVLFCTDRQPKYTHLLVENIETQNEMWEEIGAMTFRKWLELYLQVIGAIRIANKKYDFSHNDLHAANVLVKTLDTPIIVDYELYKITTNKVAVIIDYGLSYIQYKDEHIAPLHSRLAYHDRSWALGDYYKLLMHSYVEATESQNWELLMGIRRLYQYFNDLEDPDKLFNDDHVFPYLRIPYIPDIDIDEYVQYVYDIYQNNLDNEIELLDFHNTNPKPSEFDYVKAIQDALNAFERNNELVVYITKTLSFKNFNKKIHHDVHAGDILKALIIVIQLDNLYNKQLQIKEAIVSVSSLYNYKQAMNLKVAKLEIGKKFYNTVKATDKWIRELKSNFEDDIILKESWIKAYYQFVDIYDHL